MKPSKFRTVVINIIIFIIILIFTAIYIATDRTGGITYLAEPKFWLACIPISVITLIVFYYISKKGL